MASPNGWRMRDGAPSGRNRLNLVGLKQLGGDLGPGGALLALAMETGSWFGGLPPNWPASDPNPSVLW